MGSRALEYRFAGRRFPPRVATVRGCGCGSSSSSSRVAGDALSDSLAAAGLSSGDVSAAVQAHTGLNAAAQNALLGIFDGNVSASSLAPLLAAGLAATGVGAPVVAIVAAALPILEGVAHALGIFGGGDQHCDWNVGALCFKGIRPWGPGDPSWQTFANWRANPLPDPMGLLQLNPPFPMLWFLENDEQRAGVSAPDFRHAYFMAWKANAERAINGHPYATDGALLAAVLAAYQASHEGTTTAELSPDPNGGTIERLLAGVFDRQRRPPITVPLGPPKGPRGINLHGIHGALQGLSSGMAHKLAVQNLFGASFSVDDPNLADGVVRAKAAILAVAKWLNFYGAKR